MFTSIWMRNLLSGGVQRPRRSRHSFRPSLVLLEDRVTPALPVDTIQAFVYVDANSNGQPDPGEQRVTGVNVTLNVNGSDALTRATDANGRAWFGPGWGTNAAIKVTMTPTDDTGNGVPYHYW